MKIGNLEFKEYAAKKPLSLSKGEFVTAQDILDKPSLKLGSLHALSTNLQLELALKRYTYEPDFKLGFIGGGILTKDEVIDHLKEQTEFGQLALRAEMAYCDNLMADLTTNAVTPWPETPDIEPIRLPKWWRRRKKCIWLRLPTRAVFCENTTDNVTSPFAKYRIANVHPAFQARGFTIISLTGLDNVRGNFIPHAKNGLTVYLGGVGHGNYRTYTGHWGEPILSVGNYDPAEVKNKVIHYLSCQTAKQLGPDTVKNGAKSYAGYIENFILQWDDKNTPAVDEFKLFAKSDSTFDIMMANGATAQQAYDATIQAFNAAISRVPNQIAATYLTLDRDRLKLIGNPAARISPYRRVKICFPLSKIEEQNALVEAGNLVD